MKPFDIFVPTFNSGKLLPVVLPQIEKVIPASAINKKFIVDDFSSDHTREVAESLGWAVFKNKRKGLRNAQEYGFSLVTTECCAMFEHDLYLSNNWYPTIPNLVQSGECDVAQGIRIRDVRGFREMDIHNYKSRIGPTEDNTFYRMGPNGLPKWDFYGWKGTPKGVKKIKGYCIRNDVCSIHLRGNVTACLLHDYFMYRVMENDAGLFHNLDYFLRSPIISLKIFRETKGLSVLFIYPLDRLFFLLLFPLSTHALYNPDGSVHIVDSK